MFAKKNNFFCAAALGPLRIASGPAFFIDKKGFCEKNIWYQVLYQKWFGGQKCPQKRKLI